MSIVWLLKIGSSSEYTSYKAKHIRLGCSSWLGQNYYPFPSALDDQLEK